MKKMNSSTKQLILLIFNSVLTIATFVITYYIDPLKYTSQSSLAAVPAFFTFYNCVDYWAKYNYSQ